LMPTPGGFPWFSLLRTITLLCVALLLSCTAQAQATSAPLSISDNPTNRIPPPMARNEKLTSYTFADSIHITVQQDTESPSEHPPITILYALPNGNTTEQTIGRTPDPDEDWHYAIQQ